MPGPLTRAAVPVDPSTTGQIHADRGESNGGTADNSYNPATGALIRARTGSTPTTLPSIVRLADPATGQLAAGSDPGQGAAAHPERGPWASAAPWRSW